MMLKIKDLEETIKYKFNSKSLLKRCLTHKSYDENINNEKLEFWVINTRFNYFKKFVI